MAASLDYGDWLETAFSIHYDEKHSCKVVGTRKKCLETEVAINISHSRKLRKISKLFGKYPHFHKLVLPFSEVYQRREQIHHMLKTNRYIADYWRQPVAAVQATTTAGPTAVTNAMTRTVTVHGIHIWTLFIHECQPIQEFSCRDAWHLETSVNRNEWSLYLLNVKISLMTVALTRNCVNKMTMQSWICDLQLENLSTIWNFYVYWHNLWKEMFSVQKFLSCVAVKDCCFLFQLVMTIFVNY